MAIAEAASSIGSDPPTGLHPSIEANLSYSIP